MPSALPRAAHAAFSFAALALLLAAAPSSAAAQGLTWFVDAVNGNDFNAGDTRATAWKSLTHASQRLGDNDTLIVLPGTYSPSKTGELFPIQFGDTAKARTQNNIRILCEGGPSVTILDAEMGATLGAPPMRFRYDADGVLLRGLRFVNTGASEYWALCIRIGSTSGGNFAARNVEITGCVFENVHRAIVVFGTDPTVAQNQTTGINIHDNLILNATGRPLDIWGDGVNYVYNNTIYGHSTNPAAGSPPNGINADTITAAQQSRAVIANNIVVGTTGTMGAGIALGQNGGAATVLNNDCFNNPTAYGVPMLDPSNLAVDPLFVNAAAGDFHLTAASPMLQNGLFASLPVVRADLDRFPRVSDGDGDRNARVDRGALQFTRHTMTASGTWAIGQTATFAFAGAPAGAALLLMGLREGALLFQPWGMLGIDAASLLPIQIPTGLPGQVMVPIPNDPALRGLQVVLQGAYAGGTIELLNMYTRVL